MHPDNLFIPPRRLTREERRQQTDAALRQAAVREFATCGVAGTSAERIAEAAGFTRGAFYANYENKQALLLDLIREKFTAEIKNWLELAESAIGLEDLLVILNDRTRLFDPDGVWPLIAAEINLYAQRDAEFAASYRQYHGQVLDGFERIITKLFWRGGKRPPLPVGELAEAMLTLYRSTRLPVEDTPESHPTFFSPELLIVILRGLIAVAPPADSERADSSGPTAEGEKGKRRAKKTD
ncbi:TetR/AcrR family transcriptional regulator [Paraburkholderia dinghuensis]|uniref:TetR/AcrR family transcriptional regulator n=1 Tax=Paraburkholderia dinghuensis TaxID=2305225 RepID=A0A3N6MN50_9BURK|nr:TetR/AcrR family transcriptional regulator [Paraburkholderia dinghuensis]RQH04968.1 TetR/AcrR family transcriptional regulator [Paraburkholderia dinghuensis]